MRVYDALRGSWDSFLLDRSQLGRGALVASPPDGQGDRYHEVVVFGLAGEPCTAGVPYRRDGPCSSDPWARGFVIFPAPRMGW